MDILLIVFELAHIDRFEKLFQWFCLFDFIIEEKWFIINEPFNHQTLLHIQLRLTLITSRFTALACIVLVPMFGPPT